MIKWSIYLGDDLIMDSAPKISVGNPTDKKVIKKVGAYLVVDSGVLHTNIGTPIEIVIDTMIIEFNFKDDNSKVESDIESIPDKTNNSKLSLNLYNFNNVLGSGILEPVEFGTFRGVKYFITFLINGFENGVKQFAYSILTKR